MSLLKLSTAATVPLGPFLDDTDGKTAEPSLTISQADIRLSKNGGAFAQTNNAAGAMHMENGYYGVPLDTTDTATLGRLRVAVIETGALPVWQDFLVVPAMVYDSIVLGTDYLQGDVAQWLGATAQAMTGDSYAVVSNGTYGNSALNTKLGTPTASIATDIAALRQFKKNTAFAAFQFVMFLSSDHRSPATGKTIVCQRSIDGAGFVNCTNTPATEIASGAYYINLSAGDLNGNSVVLKFTEATCDTRFVEVFPQA